MSADDGYIVTRLYRPAEHYPLVYGVFHYMGEADPPDYYYTRQRAMDGKEFSSPTEAILFAHELQSTNWTEYGVSVNATVLRDCNGCR